MARRSAIPRRGRFHSGSYRPGAPPGSLAAPPGDARAPMPPARVDMLSYGADMLREDRDTRLADCPMPPADAAGVRWIHLRGLPTPAQLETLGRDFGLHPLALEDVLHREGRAKAESYGAQQFVVLDHVHRADGTGLRADPVSFFLGPNYLISIDTIGADLFEPVRQRIRSGSRIRTLGSDYLLYALLDVIVDEGFPLLEQLGGELEELEDAILDNPDAETRNRIHYIKRELLLMRRAWWPQREMIAELMRHDGTFVSEITRLHLRDCHEHGVIALELVETYREMASSLLDTYLSAVSQRMNDIMKTLTIIATIFMPLSFVAGLYGMNFDTESPWNMPELHWRFGYPYALGLMVAVVVGMLAYFRHKRWW
ncbi:magnesium/cobalt transporter CorA [Pontibaca methylaminivorans]|uniref:Magnesium transport protein CorA n=1 Tax=Pontibaca methylaminivorans TaxID=515897 RepID=A0A1R3WL12_9RHOB|nr:magnesium/cobalt transporter CorA [Pontibaca methylaminivorans]SIT78502.1 magnesium transporter [Pontibaca methylaminivorans]